MATFLNYSFRGSRGGSFEGFQYFLAAEHQDDNDAESKDNDQGFRLAMVPEPGTGLLVVAGLLGLAGWRRERLARTRRHIELRGD